MPLNTMWRPGLPTEESEEGASGPQDTNSLAELGALRPGWRYWPPSPDDIAMCGSDPHAPWGPAPHQPWLTCSCGTGIIQVHLGCWAPCRRMLTSVELCIFWASSILDSILLSCSQHLGPRSLVRKGRLNLGRWPCHSSPRKFGGPLNGPKRM